MRIEQSTACVLQHTAELTGGIRVSSGVKEKEEERDRETDTQEERKRRRETRVRDAGKQIEGHVEGSGEEKE